MKKYLNCFGFFISILLTSVFFSCADSVGLGESVDTTPPVLTITELNCEGLDSPLTSFSGGVYCKREVTISGTATDDKKVSKVYVQSKWAGESDYTYLQAASLSGDTWTADLSFEQEGVLFLKFIAEDPAKNYSNKSSKVIALFIDDTAPVASAWYIDRQLNGIQYNLKELDTLKALDLSAPENKDAAQNVSCALRANFTDTMGINADSVSVKLLDEDGNEICQISNSGTSEYAPSFSITQEILEEADSSLSTGIHYLQVLYSAEDVVTVPSSNAATDIEVEGGWLIWWPESDKPKITQSDIETDSTGAESINLYVNDTISLSVFDDDELEKTYCALLSEDEYSSFTLDWSAIESDPESIFDAVAAADQEKRTASYTASSGERETTLILHAASTPQTMHLIAIAWDNTDNHLVVEKDISVRVVDASSPILLITSPANNSVPEVTMASDNSTAKVTIEGQSLDSIGCTYLEFVWVPDSVTESGKTDKAKEWLEEIDSDSEHEACKEETSITNGDGLKLWAVSLSESTLYNDFYKQTFSLTIDLLNDFDDEKAGDKSFVAKLTRKDGNYVYTEYKLLGDTSNPEIEAVTPAYDMQIVDMSADLVLEFKGTKESGLAMDTSKYAITRVDVDPEVSISGSYDTSSGTYKATISSETLTDMQGNGIKPKYRFTAADIFGNEGYDQFTLVISDLPYLKSVSSTASSNQKKGDVIDISLTFSNTVTITSDTKPKLKLKSIANDTSSITADTVVYAPYTSGSGSTSLHFQYTVQEGDYSDQLLVYNESDAGPLDITGVDSLTSDKVILTTLTDENNLQAKKTITIDGISPSVSDLAFTSDAGSENIYNSVTYLREGKTLTVTVTASEKVYVQGNPYFIATASSEELKIPFEKTSGKKIIFSTKITDDDHSELNGAITYVPSACIDNTSVIVDSYGNELLLGKSTDSTDANYAIDTVVPATPEITLGTYYGVLNSTYYYENTATFTVSQSETIKSLQYSPDGGNTWNDTTSGTTVSLSASDYSSAQLTARATDYAGNVSDYADIQKLAINSTFPDFSIECTNSDGNYTAGKLLVFKLSFEEAVKYTPGDTAPYILVTGSGDSDTYAQGSNEGKAYLSDSSGDEITTEQSAATAFYFTYQVQDPDEFTLKVADDAVVLTGFVDMYGIGQGSSNVLSSDYERSAIRCDGVAPKVYSMTPSGDVTTASDANVYSQGNVITLVFTEEIQKSGGNITLRQVSGWAIPPVLSASDFNTICNELDDDGKEYLAMRDTDGSYLEDAQPDLGITNAQGFALDLYHGTGQYVGPYKKSMQGLKTNSSGLYVPDTETKFVLDFDIDIWETTDKHYFGKTYKTYTQSDFHTDAYQNGRLSVTPPSASNGGSLRTADGIREYLEEAGYHERVLDVTSSAVVIESDNKTVTITFPAGLCDTSDDLPYGREWELVIDKGAFMDMSGNEFGANSVGVIEQKDSVQTEGEQTDSGITGWGRYRSSVNDGETPLVLITNGSNYSFYSDKAATPVVRVDRYSYGLGIYQSDKDGNKASQIGDKASGIGDQTYADAVAPTGYVRVRIDCETKDSLISYTKLTASNSSSETAKETYTPSASSSKIYYTDSPSDLSSLSGYTSESVSNKSNVNLIFAGGNGKYDQSCKQFIVATASRYGFTASDMGSEGVWQTVLCFDPPLRNDRSTGLAANNAGYRNFYVRGTTGYGGEPYISPFPLRGGILGCPYMRITYRENNGTVSATKYYWHSYEILVDSSVMGRGSNGSGWTWNNSASDQGRMVPGGLSVITGMYLY